MMSRHVALLPLMGQLGGRDPGGSVGVVCGQVGERDA